MSRFRNVNRAWVICGIALAVLLFFSPSNAAAQSIQGHGKVSNGPSISPSQISVAACLDGNGVAQGIMVWVGSVNLGGPYPPGVGGPAEPFIMDVIDIVFDGNSAVVIGVVVASPKGSFNGSAVLFTFTDNSGTGEPDRINGDAIEAGNITVSD